MGGFVANLPDVTIASGQTDSNAIGGMDDAEALTIYAPGTLTGTITIQVAPDRQVSEGGSAVTTWYTKQSGGADITIPAGKSVTLTDIGFRQLRLHSTSAEGANRTFKLTKQVYPRA